MFPFVIVLLLIFGEISNVRSDLNHDVSKYIQAINSNEFLNKSAPLSSKCGEFFGFWNLIFNKDNLLYKRLRMLDASSKLQSGLEELNLFSLGSFDECYNTEDTYEGTAYKGKYCFGSISQASFQSSDVTKSITWKFHKLWQENPQLRVVGSPDDVGLHFAQCMPNFCTVEDFHSRFSLLSFQESNCFSKDTKPEFEAGTIVTIGILGVFLGIVTVSTMYDFILEYKEKKPAHPAYVAFSFLSNWRKIVQTNKEQLACLNGIRALSMMWIILFHDYLHVILTAAMDNYWTIIQFVSKTESLLIVQGAIAVDSFLAVGGLVLVYTFFKSSEKGRKYNVIMSYIHRYFRLTPVLAIMILIHAFLLIHMGNGPLWNTLHFKLIDNCRTYWWSALLYIQTYVNTTENCVPQTWYLSVDMQLFVLAPILLIPLRKWPKYTLGVMVGLIGAGIAIPFSFTYTNDLPVGPNFLNSKTPQYNQYVYYQTYSRFGPYVIGMVAGYFVYKLQKRPKINLNLMLVLAIWLGILASFAAIIFGPINDIKNPTDNYLSHAFYNGFFRSAWAAAVCAMAIMCIIGYGGPVNKLLSHPILQILGKLSYCMYIIHYPVILLRITSMRTQTHFNHYLMLFNYGGDFLITMLISVVYCMTFELPFMVVEKYFVNFVLNLLKCRLSFNDKDKIKKVTA